MRRPGLLALCVFAVWASTVPALVTASRTPGKWEQGRLHQIKKPVSLSQEHGPLGPVHPKGTEQSAGSRLNFDAGSSSQGNEAPPGQHEAQLSVRGEPKFNSGSHAALATGGTFVSLPRWSIQPAGAAEGLQFRSKRASGDPQGRKSKGRNKNPRSESFLKGHMNESYQSPTVPAEPQYLALNDSHILQTGPDDFEINHGLIPRNTSSKRPHLKNPFYPLTEESYGAYGIMCLAVIIFVIGIMGNMAIMCIVCHNYYMRSISNSLLANLAFWDFLIIFFCLPLVIFHELAKKWLLEDFSCKIVPYIEVASLGVTTFTLCALCIDRFRAATNVQMYYEMIENCKSTTAKLAVIWFGALVLALPEVILRQRIKESPEMSGSPPADRCVVKISTDLPETIYVLALTYDGARLWWYFGCYFCLPTVFTITCSLVTAKKIRRAEKSSTRGNKRQIHLESQMNCTVVALTILYGFCIIPENICNIATSYMSTGLSRQTMDLLHLISQFLLFFKSCVTPILLFCFCKPFSRAFMECCCCCCEECAQKSSVATSDDNDNEYTTELELSPFSTIRREMSTFASVGTHC